MSYYTSISGLKNAQTSLNVISHNIANAETNGFKKSRTEFGDIVASSALANPKRIQGSGSVVESITQNFSIGPVEQTGSALDLAITGDGFFETRSAAGQVLYTRNGSFAIDAEGYIHDGSGNRLQGFIAPAGTDPTDPPATGGAETRAVGAFKIPAFYQPRADTPEAPADPQTPDAGPSPFTGIVISGDGKVIASYANGKTTDLGTVSLTTFVSPSGLKQVGSSNWERTGLSGEATRGAPNAGANGALLAGAIEHSNVDIAEELVNLITAQRYFQANAKAIDTATQISQTIIQLRS